MPEFYRHIKAVVKFVPLAGYYVQNIPNATKGSDLLRLALVRPEEELRQAMTFFGESIRHYKKSTKS